MESSIKPSATKNATFWLLPALGLVMVLRLWQLPFTALPDYDSVRNWQILQEVAYGDWQHIFHHGSPGFYLLFAPAARLTTDYRVFLELNALVAVLALGIFAFWLTKVARLSGPEAALLTLLTGSSTYLTFSGRDFTMSSLSLLAFALLLQAYWWRLQQPSRRTLLTVAAWLAFGLTTNYKFMLVVPIMAVIEWQQSDGLLWRTGNWWRVGLVVAAPFMVLSVLAWLISGVPLYRWPAFFFVFLFPAVPNPAGRQGSLQVDDYYLRYLADYESPVLLPALAAALVVFGWGLRQRPMHVGTYLLVWAACTLAGMSLLVKAPRGLLFAYFAFYGLAILLLQRWSRALAWSILVASIAYNVWLVQREVYAYSPTNYDQVARWLKQYHIQHVVSTVGAGIVPFAQPLGIRVDVASTAAQLTQYRQQGAEYVLLDGYHRVTSVPGFDSLYSYSPLAAWHEPMLIAPLAFLEHSEYAGLRYRQSLQRQQQAARNSVQLRLIRIAKPH